MHGQYYRIHMFTESMANGKTRIRIAIKDSILLRLRVMLLMKNCNGEEYTNLSDYMNVFLEDALEDYLYEHQEDFYSKNKLVEGLYLELLGDKGPSEYDDYQFYSDLPPGAYEEAYDKSYDQEKMDEAKQREILKTSMFFEIVRQRSDLKKLMKRIIGEDTKQESEKEEQTKAERQFQKKKSIARTLPI